MDFGWDRYVGEVRFPVILLATMALALPFGGVSGADNGLALKILAAPPGKNPEIQFAAWPTRVRDYGQFVAATRYAGGEAWRNPGFAQTPEDPVVCVSYFDSLEFCRWLTQTERAAGRLGTKQCYRLPTDDEWQSLVDWAYDGLKFPWSTSQPGLRDAKDWPPTWYHGNYAGEEVVEAPFWPAGREHIKGYRDDFAGTAPVTWGGSDRWGYHDLSGNVRQWTSTPFRRDLNRASLREENRFLDRDSDETGKSSKVLRGSAWNDYLPALLELDTRVPREPQSRDAAVGFRIVLAPGEVPKD